MPTLADERTEAANLILDSTHPRKVIVAGAGAGKTFVFEGLLDKLPTGDPKARVVVTFINELKGDLETALGERAYVGTVHGFCRHLLHKYGMLRGPALTGEFEYFPRVAQLIPKDWEIINKKKAPPFVTDLRTLTMGRPLNFFLERASYYDAVGFDDAAIRVHEAIQGDESLTPRYDLIIVDEFQDLNRAEVELLRLLALKSPIVVAGDDDQALYGDLRCASVEHIRAVHADPEWKSFPLPFCSRCPGVIVDAVNDVVGHAKGKGLLMERIDKPYRPFPNAADALHPRIRVVHTTIQGLGVRNYCGRYLVKEIEKIPEEDIHESHEKGYPTVLVIGAAPYLTQAAQYLEESGYVVETKSKGEGPMEALTIEDAWMILRDRPRSNLGWRIAIEVESPAFREAVIGKAGASVALESVLPSEYRERVLREALAWTPVAEVGKEDEASVDSSKPRIKVVTFEGSKGLSAQHVFVVGCQKDVLPRGKVMTDVDVCRFIVAATRTRKQCHLIYTTRLAGKVKAVSDLLSWIKPARREHIDVNKEYWK
jgi:superfamily I DNA/RNA helicase